MATGNKAWISGHLFPSSGYIIWLTVPLRWGRIQGGAVEAFWPVHCGLTARVKDEMTLQLNRESSYMVGTWNFKLLFFSPFVPFVAYEALWQTKRTLPPLPHSNCSTLFYSNYRIFVSFFPCDLEMYTREKLKWNTVLWSSSESYKIWSPFFPDFWNNKGEMLCR